MATSSKCIFKKVIENRKERCSRHGKYAVIQALSSQFPVSLLCAAAGIARSSYYKWLKTGIKQKDAAVCGIISFEHRRLGGIYGYRRMKAILLTKYGLHLNRKRVYRLMKQMNMQAIIRRRRYPRIQYKRHTLAPNLLDRHFQAAHPNQKWVTDITYLQAGKKRYFLSVILDLFNNEVVSYRLSDSLDVQFVLETVQEAVQNRSTHQLLIHSDQGMHYTTKAYYRLLRKHGIIQSMSRKGNCLDNACIESFFGHLKAELRPHLFDEAVDVGTAIKKYIEFYNHERPQMRLNGMSPSEFRNLFLQSA
ncbi:IS3 family transposase [Brevibacillus sp. FSL K6-2834]|uniref:IS3 family transposase n=1 Tax=Brevibacillus sp. FSL K6-2834 TaxID=2954680 RepID=UPI0031587032